MGIISIILPEPPSVNALWRVRKGGAGIYSTKEYKEWLKVAGWDIIAQGRHRERISGPYTVIIELAGRKDVDSVSKACLDLLKRHITDDDRYCKSVTCTKMDDIPAGKCRVHVAPWVANG